MMNNLLLENIEYKTEETRFGRWRRYMYASGQTFDEYKTNRTLFGLPLIHYTHGKCPETGRRIVAKGIIGVGKLATGVIAIGHASVGVIAVGQLAISPLFGFGQAAIGAFAVGQLALGVIFGLGQFATGVIAIGQFAVGKYVLAQIGFGEYVWSTKRADSEAYQFFKFLLNR
jgi:hypothetical protein